MRTSVRTVGEPPCAWPARENPCGRLGGFNLPFPLPLLAATLVGALLVEYVTAWEPSSWLYPETFLFLTALIVGGRTTWPAARSGRSRPAGEAQRAPGAARPRVGLVRRRAGSP